MSSFAHSHLTSDAALNEVYFPFPDGKFLTDNPQTLLEEGKQMSRSSLTRFLI